MKLPVYPIGSFYFIRGKLSSIRSGTTSTSGQSSKELQFANLLLRNAPLKPDPDMEKRLNDPLIQYYIKFIYRFNIEVHPPPPFLERSGKNGGGNFRRAFSNTKNKGEASASPNGLINFVLQCTIII